MNQKGFTLIELLVVVAIIGILAAVGVVAFNGYTAGARVNSTKFIYNQVQKYISSEIQKCNMGETTVMNDYLTCSNKTGSTVIKATEKSLSNFKNPYNTANKAVVASVTEGEEVGFVIVTDDGSDVTVKTCFAEVGDGPDCIITITDENFATSGSNNVVAIE